ncbi:MAG: hypothetical protein EPN30_00980 [Actinomycetota bacterium]|nr:MAG: hypothetical protein EPN30_00980 [Actinomycetota bacterium]
MAKAQREMRLRNARPEVNTQAALALARASAGARNPSGAGAKHKVAYERPQLIVVERPRKLAGFRISNKMFLAYLIGFLALFAAVVMRAEMAATQLKLNALNSQLASIETQHQRLEVQLSALESPDRIVSYAESHLGMIYPSQVGYLGAAPTSTPSQTSSTELTPQVISAPDTLFAPAGEAGGGAPTKTPVSSSTPTTAASRAKGSTTTSVASSAGSSSAASPSSSPKTG